MKFIYADSLDYVDPDYDFVNDEFAPNRKPYWDDVFAHELFSQPPYDGLLVSRALLGGNGVSGKYTESQAMRFMREGVQKFLRVGNNCPADFMLMGDNGAFSYHQLAEPPYSPTEVVEFYEGCGFTHGCSIDHIIFEYGKHGAASDEALHRYELTLNLASDFLKEHHRQHASFTPIGVVQGYSPESMRSAAQSLLDMGYRYLAIGGLVPLRIDAIREAVGAVHQATCNVADARIHLLGFAKAEHIDEFRQYQVASFDSTSPLLRAFKDNSRNYWRKGSDGRLDFFSAIRVPQAYDNVKLKNRVKKGEVSQEELVKCERRTLESLRDYDRESASLDDVLDNLTDYSRYLHESPSFGGEKLEAKLQKLRSSYRETLSAKVWKECGCKICEKASIEVVLFRASNRNKRRGMHNLFVFHDYVKQLQAA